MTESKIDLTDRLRREGRWAEASRFKDTALTDFRSKGMKKAEATEAAWDAMEEAFPPLSPVEPPKVSQGVESLTVPAVPEEEAGIDSLLERTGNNDADLPRDVLWAYDHLENRRVKPHDAPSLGAWSLLKWARDYRSRFFEQLLPKALAVKPAEDEKMVRWEKRRIEEIEAMIRKAGEKMEGQHAPGDPG